MRKLTISLVALTFLTSASLFSQERDALRASRMSFRSAERHFSNGDYRQASQEYLVVVNLVPADTDSRRDLNNRLESLIRLTDIYLNRSVEFEKGCEYLNQYLEDMPVVRGSGVLRASELLDFTRKEQEFIGKRTSVCEKYEKSEPDIERMRKELEQEIK